jgi:hypothetical protein
VDLAKKAKTQRDLVEALEAHSECRYVVLHLAHVAARNALACGVGLEKLAHGRLGSFDPRTGDRLPGHVRVHREVGIGEQATGASKASNGGVGFRQGQYRVAVEG